MKTIKANTNHYLEAAVIQSDGDFASGLTVTFELRRSSDNALIDSGTMTEEGNIYKALINVPTEQYRATYFTPTNFENGFQDILVQDIDLNDVKIDLDLLKDKVCDILGLVMCNYRLTDMVYDSNDCLTSGKVSIYDNAVDATNQTNPRKELQITPVYDAEQNLIDYLVVQI